jgi:hypothetical protein
MNTAGSMETVNRVEIAVPYLGWKSRKSTQEILKPLRCLIFHTLIQDILIPVI